MVAHPVTVDTPAAKSPYLPSEASCFAGQQFYCSGCLGKVLLFLSTVESPVLALVYPAGMTCSILRADPSNLEETLPDASGWFVPFQGRILIMSIRRIL